MNPTIIVGLTSLALLCAAGGGLLAAIDAAYTELSRGDIEELADDYPQKAARLETIGNHLERHLLTLNFFRVTFDTLAAILITVVFGTLFTSVWIILLTAALAVGVVNILVIGVSPRKIGSRYPERLVRATTGVVRLLDTIILPLTPLIDIIGQRTLSARESQDERLKNEQIFSLVDRAAEQELLEEDEQDIIHSVVEFSDTLVKEVMVPRTDMVTIEADSTVQQTLDFFLTSPFSRIPVTSGDSDAVAGVVHLRDVVSYAHRRPEDAQRSPVTRVMKPAQFVPDLQRTDELLKQMQREANHLALAVDEYGGIAGLVTLEDLIEELIGEINDEHDRESADIEEREDGTYLINARLGIEELGDLFDEDIEDDDVETVGGLVAKMLGRLSEEGDVVTISGIALTVVEVEKKRQRLVSVVAQWVGKHDPDMIEDPENEEQDDDQ